MAAQDLSQKFQKLEASVRNAEKWLADNKASYDVSETDKKNLRRLARNFKNYAEAAGRNTGVAVFGPSQSGKSTLISALGRGPSGGLKADFNGQRLDFAMEINPEGGNETTGLVTRFSLRPAPPSPDPALPVAVKLFSEMDLVKILTNTYFAEARGKILVEESDLVKKIDELAARPPGRGNLTLDDMEDLNEYVSQLAPENAYCQNLDKHFWPKAVTMALRLDHSGQAELFSFLWGRLKPFTEVFLKLRGALESLNFSETVYCGISALYDRERGGRDFTVLHVDRLEGLLGGLDETKTGPPVKVMAPDGKTAELSRPVLSALIAELHVMALEKPGDFLEYSDLLDFPGYRAREKMDDIVEDVQKPEILKKCFLRGKVAYLFERYRARKDISAMLLCVAESVQNNPDLPSAVTAWVVDTHGDQPEKRVGQAVSLFMVLTKFDRLLERGTGSTETLTRWENRLKASFTQFFEQKGWPEKWAGPPGRETPFNNLFWLLNLSYAEAFLKVENLEPDPQNPPILRAAGLQPGQADWVESVRQGYLGSKYVRTHIADPESAWKAVMESADGGVAYILSKLSPVVATDLKTVQLTALARKDAEQAKRILSPFYHGAGAEEEMAIKTKSATELVTAIFGVGRRQLFGELLRDLELDDEECQAVYNNPQPEEDEDRESSSKSGGGSSTDSPSKSLSLDDIWGKPNTADEAEAPPSPSPALVPVINDAARRYRRRLEAAWQAKLDRTAGSERNQKYFKLSPELFQTLVTELRMGAGEKRLGVFNQVESQFREALSYSNDNPDRVVWKQARLAATLLSSYVNWLGFSPLEHDSSRRTFSVAERTFTVFEPPPTPGLFLELPEKQPDIDQSFYLDWTAALFRMMLDNLVFAEKNYDMEQNARLGQIIKEVDTTVGLL